MNKVDGKAIKADIKERLREVVLRAGVRPRLTLVYVGENPVIDTYVELKRRFGEDIGVHVDVDRYPSDITPEKMKEVMEAYEEGGEGDGIVLQLPLPDSLDVDEVISWIDPERDVDVLGSEAFMRALKGELPLPPVVGAVEEVFKKYGVVLEGKNIVVVGRGKLVGKPLSLWLLSKKCTVNTLEKGDDIRSALSDADIVISGTGSAHLITPDMVKERVVLIDAGTSDIGGETKGDMHPDVGEKASLYSPVPGGIGPITVAKLFENLLILKKLL